LRDAQLRPSGDTIDQSDRVEGYPNPFSLAPDQAAELRKNLLYLVTLLDG